MTLHSPLYVCKSYIQWFVLLRRLYDDTINATQAQLFSQKKEREREREKTRSKLGPVCLLYRYISDIGALFTDPSCVSAKVRIHFRSNFFHFRSHTHTQARVYFIYIYIYIRNRDMKRNSTNLCEVDQVPPSHCKHDFCLGVGLHSNNTVFLLLTRKTTSSFLRTLQDEESFETPHPLESNRLP